MSERNYYVISDDNCLFPAMTKEQVLNAIAEATGETVTDIDQAFITMIKEKNGNRNLKFWIGTQAQYNAITPEDDVAYIITDADAFGTLETRVADNYESILDIYDKLSKFEDFVYSESDKDGWHIRKWVSGRVEAEKTITQSIEKTSYPPIAWSQAITINYPSETFASVTDVPIVSINDINSWISGIAYGNNNVSFRVYSATTGTQNTKITIRVTGTHTRED